MFDRKNHWETIYNSKKINEVSWYQIKPESSLNFILDLNLDKNSSIIDIGGGDSFLVDFLLENDFTNITVLDISEAAIERAKLRLGTNANKVKWIVSDITKFETSEKYDLWHDRAAFHFLTNESEISLYKEKLNNFTNKQSNLIIATFSENGPTKCSGIEISQYSEDKLVSTFSDNFEKVNCKNIDHTTPFDTIQNFTFCHFRKK